MADTNELKPMTARLLQSIAAECYRDWDADRDSRVGKILRALADPEFAKDYRADIAELHAALNATATPPADAALADETVQPIEACLEDDAGELRLLDPDCEIARNMDDAAALIRRQAAALRARAVPDALRELFGRYEFWQLAKIDDGRAMVFISQQQYDSVRAMLAASKEAP